MSRPLVGVMTLVAGVCLSTAGRPAEIGPPPRTTSSPGGDALELVVLGENKLIRLRLRAEFDGRPITEVWDETFGRLFTFHDRNGDGALDEAEAARLPSPFELRQVLWGQVVARSGPAVAWKDLDRDGNGKVTRDELAGFYRRAGLGNMLIGIGRPLGTDALTDALLKHLDVDGDGRVGEAEWRAAPETLRKLDRNDDELIGPGELVPKTSYPGAIGSILLSPPAPADRPVRETDGLPLIVLPSSAPDAHWAAVIVRRRDRDGNGRLDAREAGLSADTFARLDVDKDGTLTASELATWRALPPDICWYIRLGKRVGGVPAVDWAPRPDPGPAELDRLTGAVSRVQIDLRLDDGKLPEAAAAVRKRFLSLFAEADADGNGVIDPAEATKRGQYELKQLVEVADRDGDGRLGKKELTDWLDLQDQVAKGHVLLTVLDHGSGLFELLDVNHDGALSVRELRGTWERVRSSGCLTEGQFDRAKLPRRLFMTASCGHPQAALDHARKRGPEWFRQMDRNGDGDVSRKEFLGTREQFEALDLDKDGLIDADEAARFKARAP